MAVEHRMIHFRTDGHDEVVAEIGRIAGRGDGAEWVTIGPWVDPQDLPVTSVLRRLFTARGPRVPEVTWVPAHGSEPAQLGVLHGSGPDAHGRARQAGVSIPENWVVVSDHSKRGLLFAVHPDTGPESVVEVAIALARALADVATDDRWIAQVTSTT